MDPRLSNTASMADYWMPTYPGSEAAVMLAWVKILLDDGTYNRDYMENWVNWEEYMEKVRPDSACTFENFIEFLKEEYAEFTPEYAAKESGLKPEMIVEIGKKIGAAGDRFASHTWRSASIGNLGGWAVSRALHFLSVVTGSVGSVGGTAPNSWSKFKPELFDVPPKQKFWNELHYPAEYPLAFFEMSFLLPHMLKDGNRGKMDVYFTRVFNPVWTYPDGFTWIEALTNEDMFGCHIAMTPTWNTYYSYILYQNKSVLIQL